MVSVSAAISLALLCIALISIVPNPAGAQTQTDAPTRDQYFGGESVTPPAAPDCPSGFDRLSAFSSATESDDTFRITEEQLRVLYAVTSDRTGKADRDGSFVIEVTQGGDPLEDARETDISDSVIEESLTADLTESGLVLISTEGSSGVEFSVTICQRGDDDGDVNDPDDVVPGTADDDPLPNTGGFPVSLGVAGLLVAAALISRKMIVS